MAYVELRDKDLPERYEPAWDNLQNVSSEAPFMESAFYLLREALHWMTIISSLKPPTPLDRSRAIIRGLLVRVTKLLRLTIRELSSQETFQQLSVTRDTVETLGTLVYLLGDDGTGVRFDQYVMSGLVAEREFLRDIQSNVKDCGGDTWPIEERMKRSIVATAKAGGIDDVSTLPGRSRIGFPSAEARIKLLGPNAYIVYRMGSGETHGDWTDLFRNHLTCEDGEFSPNLNSAHVRPQNPLILTILSVSIVVDNLARVIEDAAVATSVRPELEDLVTRARKVDELHERLLQSFPSRGAAT